MNAKASLYQFIEGLRNQYPTIYYDRDIESFCNKNNIALFVKEFDSNGICGAACIGKNCDTIILNGKRTQKEMFFDFIHEFIHTRKHRQKDIREFACFDKKQNSFLEWEANEGAAEFLVRFKLFIPTFCELYEIYTNNPDEWKLKFGTRSIIQELANRFNVTDMIVLNRIKNLSYEIDQYRKGTDIDQIYFLSGNQQIQYNITPTNYSESILQKQVEYDLELPWDGLLSANY